MKDCLFISLAIIVLTETGMGKPATFVSDLGAGPAGSGMMQRTCRRGSFNHFASLCAYCSAFPIPRRVQLSRRDVQYVDIAGMPSIEESKRQVKACLSQSKQQDVDHDAILASLEEEIDKHNQSVREEKERGSSSKFRFKSGTSDPRRRKRSRDREHDRKSRKHRRRRDEQRGGDEDESAAHPFPREPTNPDGTAREDPSAAFRDSLFDALADDEGAAYWESVYSQPIHVYPRPTVETARGELEQMNDEQYAAYVQTRMWEKKNPQIVLERERKEKSKREEEAERVKQREEFVRRKQRAAWDRANKDGARKFAGLDSDGEERYEYVLDPRGASQRSKDDAGEEYRHAWMGYLAAWDKLKLELLHARESQETPATSSPSQRIPWPVLQSKPVTKPNIEDFMRHASATIGEEGPTKLQILKMERVKWHPDKIQQRFTGSVDEGTMKIVTGIFHVVDAMLEDERNR